MSKKILIFILILIFGLTLSPFFAFSENSTTPVGGNKEEIDELNKKINEKKDKIKQIEASIAEYQKKVDQKRLEATSLSNQMSILDNRITQVGLDIEITEEKLQSLSLEIESLKLMIQDKEKVIARQKVILAELIRKINEQNNKKFIEVLAAYNNFSDFYNQLQYTETVQRDLGKSAKALRLNKEDLESKKMALEERKSAYEKTNELLTNKKKDLESQVFVKETLLAQTHSSELQYKTLVSNLKKQYQAIDNEISGIEKEVRKKLEEQSKIKKEDSDIGGNLSWPTQSRYITAYFHDKDYPYRNIFEHNAVDIAVSQGTPIKAAASGYVARAKICSSASCYAYTMIIHSGGISTVYGHMSKITVGEDQFVTRGDVIGYSGGRPGTIGAGPFTTGAHLHLEVRKNGIPVNPLGYLVKDY